jgi:hypothetical protein
MQPGQLIHSEFSPRKVSVTLGTEQTPESCSLALHQHCGRTHPGHCGDKLCARFCMDQVLSPPPPCVRLLDPGRTSSSCLPTALCTMHCPNPLPSSTKDREWSDILSLLSQTFGSLSHPKSCQLLPFFPVPLITRGTTVLKHTQCHLSCQVGMLAQKLVASAMVWHRIECWQQWNERHP